MPRVMFVEDDFYTTYMIERMRLDFSDLEVACWSSAEIALGHLWNLTEVLPDGIVIDIGLPGMSGIEMLRRIKADERLRGVPVLMFTASDYHYAEALAAGLPKDAYLLKPNRADDWPPTMSYIEAFFSAGGTH